MPDRDTTSDAEANARVKRVAIKVFAVQIVTLIALWLLNVLYGAS